VCPRRYARGIGFAALGRVDEAAKEAAAIGSIEQQSEIEGLVKLGIPAPTVLPIARQVLTARIAQARGYQPGAIVAFETPMCPA
jgi:hypothetical protein